MRALVCLVFMAVALTGCMGADPGQGDGMPIEDLPQDAGPDGGPVEDVADVLAYYGADGDPVLGNTSAPVQVVAYDAPGCSSCRQYHVNNYPDVKADFIDTDRIGYHFVQWTVGYAYDKYASIGLECLHREGGGQAYADGVDRAFANQTYGRWSDAGDDGVRAWLTDTAQQHSIDAADVIACYDARETLGEYEADIDAGKDSGAGWNPGFVIITDDTITTVRGAAGPYDAIAEALSA